MAFYWGCACCLECSLTCYIDCLNLFFLAIVESEAPVIKPLKRCYINSRMNEWEQWIRLLSFVPGFWLQTRCEARVNRLRRVILRQQRQREDLRRFPDTYVTIIQRDIKDTLLSNPCCHAQSAAPDKDSPSRPCPSDAAQDARGKQGARRWAHGNPAGHAWTENCVVRPVSRCT